MAVTRRATGRRHGRRGPADSPESALVDGRSPHPHDSAPTGSSSPYELVRQAFDAGRAAVRDHRPRQPGGLPRGGDVRRRPLASISSPASRSTPLARGISPQLQDGELHILGFGMDPADEAFEAALARAAGRTTRSGSSGTDRAAAGDRARDRRPGRHPGPDGRRRARPAHDRAGADRRRPRFDRRGRVPPADRPWRPAYVQREGMGPREAIEAIRAAGGVTSLAHFSEAPSQMPLLRELAGSAWPGSRSTTSRSIGTRSAVGPVARRLGLMRDGRLRLPRRHEHLRRDPRRPERAGQRRDSSARRLMPPALATRTMPSPAHDAPPPDPPAAPCPCSTSLGPWQARPAAPRSKTRGSPSTGPRRARSRAFHVWTLGCQMNRSDSEEMAGRLLAAGCAEAPSMEAADLIVINTCAIREAAEQKVIGRQGAPAAAQGGQPRPARGAHRLRRARAESGRARVAATRRSTCSCGPTRSPSSSTASGWRRPRRRSGAIGATTTGRRRRTVVGRRPPAGTRAGRRGRRVAPRLGDQRLAADHLRLRQDVHLLHRAVQPRARSAAARSTRSSTRRGRSPPPATARSRSSARTSTRYGHDLPPEPRFADVHTERWAGPPARPPTAGRTSPP